MSKSGYPESDPFYFRYEKYGKIPLGSFECLGDPQKSITIDDLNSLDIGKLYEIKNELANKDINIKMWNEAITIMNLIDLIIINRTIAVMKK